MKIIITILLAFLSAPVFSQSYEGSIEYLKKDQKAMVIEFPYAPSVVEDAIIDKMEKLGYKKKESKGFIQYKGAVLSEISSEPADYLIRVERKSRKEKDESVVYLIVNRGEENIIARTDALLNSNIKSFLNNLSPDVDSFNLELEIGAQQKLVEKAQKKLKDLIKDKEDMEKKIKNLQDDIVDNTKDQESQQKTIETQLEVLEAMKGKRKS
jgi:hypothetical protein